MGHTISIFKCSDNVNEDIDVYASNDLDLFSCEYKVIYDLTVFNRSYKTHTFHKYMIVENGRVNLFEYMQVYENDSLVDIIINMIRYDTLKQQDYTVVNKLPRSRKKQQALREILGPSFAQWKTIIQITDDSCEMNDNDNEYNTLDECVKGEDKASKILIKSVLHDVDQYCTAIAYGYPIMVEMYMDNSSLFGTKHMTGYVLCLMIGYDKDSNEFIFKTPYGWKDYMGDTLRCSFEVFMSIQSKNCILYTQSDINKVLS